MNRQFFSSVILTVLAQILFGVFTIVDGFFIGNSVGDNGLAAIGLVYPIVAILGAIGTGIGMGGAILQKIHSASGSTNDALVFERVTIALLFIFSMLSMIIVIPDILSAILQLVGAENIVFEYGRIYLQIIFLGAITQIFGNGLPPLIRNHNSPSYAMIIMAAGFIFNIVFDYLFVMRFNWGLAGAAIATISGQAITAFLGIIYFINRKIPVFHLSFNFSRVWQIFRAGISSFGLYMCPSISLLLMNLFAAKYGGMPAVTCYTVISYVTWIVYLIFQGTGDGCQPLFSDRYGRKNKKALRLFERRGYIFVLIVAVICMLLLFLFRNDLGDIFGVSSNIGIMIGQAVPVIITGFIPLSYSRITTARLYAITDTARAVILTYSEFVFMLIFLIIFTAVGGLNMVWWSLAFSHFSVGILAILMNILNKQDK